MNRHVGPYFQPAPQQMPPDRAPISKAPANQNDDGYDENDPDFIVGALQYDVRKAIGNLRALTGYDDCRDYVAMIINDMAGGRRQ